MMVKLHMTQRVSDASKFVEQGRILADLICVFTFYNRPLQVEAFITHIYTHKHSMANAGSTTLEYVSFTNHGMFLEMYVVVCSP